MGANDYNSDFGCTPMEHRQQIDSLIGALGLIDSPTDLFGPHVIRLAAQFIYDAQQKPSRREIAAMAMQGLLSDPNVCMAFDKVAAMAVRAADALIEQLSADPVAEGVNLLPMHSSELDEGLNDDQDKGASR
jgi:hypothetical protein